MINKKSSTYLYSLILSSVFLFSNLSLGGIGVFILLLLSLVFLLIIQNQIIYLKINKTILIYYSLFFIVYVAANIINESTSGESYYFLASSYANIFWIIIIPGVFSNKDRMVEIISLWIRVYLFIIICIWLVLFVSEKNLFFMRDFIHNEGVLNSTIFRNPNFFARNLFLLFPLLIFLFKKNRTQVYGFLLITNYLLLMTTLSRAMIIASTIFLIFAFYKEIKKYILYFLILLLPLLIFSFPERVIDRMLSIGSTIETLNLSGTDYAGWVDLESSIRARTWNASLNIVYDNPYFGVGFDNVDYYQELYGAVKFIGYRDYITIAVHGGLLKILVIGGGLSLLFFLLFYSKLILIFLRSSFDFVRLFATFMVLLLVVNLVADNFSLSSTWVVIAILLFLSSHGQESESK
jgi:hypothetical protein